MSTNYVMQMIKLKPDYLYMIFYKIHTCFGGFLANSSISNIVEHFNVTIYFSYAAPATQEQHAFTKYVLFLKGIKQGTNSWVGIYNKLVTEY